MKDSNTKIPILMYHEVSRETNPNGRNELRMTPLYNLDVKVFEAQINLLAENGYKGISFEDIAGLTDRGKYVMITFDDGLKGNYDNALPVLQKYNFKATVFVATGRIGTERFMTWEELKELVRQGISVQSHTVSHNPLQSLVSEEVRKELYESKKAIEDRLGQEVFVLSLPHGSYNKDVISMARKTGYKYVCTSETQRTYYCSFKAPLPVLGRLTITSKMSLKQFSDSVEYNGKEFLMRMIAKKCKNMLKQTIGINNYRRLYRNFFKIKPS